VARVTELALLLLLEHLPPLAEALGRVPGHLSGDLLPLVVVLGLQADDQTLLLLLTQVVLSDIRAQDDVFLRPPPLSLLRTVSSSGCHRSRQPPLAPAGGLPHAPT
jgi:hypothetical protein